MGKKFLGGFVIGLGCMAYVSCENRYVGAFLFSLGLLTICSQGLELFTGKLCFSKSLKDLFLTWVLNIFGAVFAAGLFELATGITCTSIAYNKLSNGAARAYFAGILCEVCIYIAVLGYKTITSDVAKVLSLVLGVMVFVLCGFEHCIADAFYMIFIGLGGVQFLLIVTVGNIVGAAFMRWITSVY